jgi:tRNA U38,U39,U40 pseudouridine synthase TruA
LVAVPVTRLPEDLGRLLKSLNALTPDHVAIREVSIVDDGFDPRRARSRLYV